MEGIFVDLRTSIAGIALEHPLMNAAGTCKSLEDVKKLARSATSAIMVGSITKEPRTGNEGDVYWPGNMYSLNSLGLPNRGAEYYKQVLPEMVSIAHGEGKPLFVSVAGFSPKEYAELAELALEGGADLSELNLGCPNVWAGGVQKRIACFDADLVSEVIELTTKRVGPEAKVGAKLSPCSDRVVLEHLASWISDSPLVKVVVTTNTFPNAFDFNENGKPRISPANGLAGLAGPAMKPIGLGQVRQLREFLHESIQIIGVGGITYGKDALDYRRCGAVATQIATAYLKRGENVFSELLFQLVEADADV